MISCSTVNPPMPESKTPIALSWLNMNSLLCRRVHLNTEIFFTCRRKTEDLLPNLTRFHAKIDFYRRPSAANPAHHFAVHRDAQRLKVAQLAVRAENLLAG